MGDVKFVVSLISLAEQQLNNVQLKDRERKKRKKEAWDIFSFGTKAILFI